MTDAADIRARLTARFAPGWPAALGVPDTWLEHLDALDAQLAAIDPDYRLVQVKTKFGGLRYYLEDIRPLPCCAAWLDAHPLEPDADEAAEAAWNAAAELHDTSAEHQRVEAAAKSAEKRMRALIDAAEAASYRW